MNKVELADAVAQKVGGTRGDAEKVIAATVEVISEQLKAGNEVTITGFGSFSVSHRAARTGVNPQNPTEKIQITPFAGFEQNNQIGVSDIGLVYGSEANVDRYELGDFEVNSIFKFHNEDISPRRNSLRVLSFDLKNNFEADFSNNFIYNQTKTSIINTKGDIYDKN